MAGIAQLELFRIVHARRRWRALHHEHSFKHKTLIIVGFGILTVLAYYRLLGDLGIVLPTGG